LHAPLSRCQIPSRKTTLSVTGAGNDGAVNDSGLALRYASALYMNVLKISAGYVPPATGCPPYSVDIGRSLFG